MPDGSDPGRVERYVERQVERVRLQVSDPNKTDILKTIRKGRLHPDPEADPAQQDLVGGTDRPQQRAEPPDPRWADSGP